MLRTADAMVLLVGKVDPNTIHILGQWRLDTMFRYLYLLAQPIVKDFVAKILNTDYALAPFQLVSCH